MVQIALEVKPAWDVTRSIAQTPAPTRQLWRIHPSPRPPWGDSDSSDVASRHPILRHISGNPCPAHDMWRHQLATCCDSSWLGLRRRDQPMGVRVFPWRLLLRTTAALRMIAPRSA
jgi:hypothetical protein